MNYAELLTNIYDMTPLELGKEVVIYNPITKRYHKLCYSQCELAIEELPREIG